MYAMKWVKESFMILNPKLREERISQNLLNSTEKILAKTFFEILKTNNLSLLNPKRIRVSKKRLNDVWAGLREDYYKGSDPQKYKSDFSKAKRVDYLNNEIAGCTSAIYLFELTGKIHFAFKKFGYDVKDSKDVARVNQKLKIRKTELRRIIAGIKKQDQKETIEFYSMVVDLEAGLNKTGLLHGGINTETINLARWISYIKSLKKADGKNR